MDNSESLNSLYAGKKAWNNMLRNKKIENLLTEAIGDDILDPTQAEKGAYNRNRSGRSATGKQVHANIASLLEDNEDFQKMTKQIELYRRNKKIAAMVNLVAEIAIPLSDRDGLLLSQVLTNTINDITTENEKLIKKAQEFIRKYNEAITDAIKRHQRDIHSANTEIPADIKNLTEFKAMNVLAGGFPHIIVKFLPLINQALVKKGSNVQLKVGADQYIKEADSSFNTDIKTNTGSAVTGIDDDNKETEIDKLFNWLKGSQGVDRLNFIIDILVNMYLVLNSVDLNETFIAGLKKKLQRANASEKAAAARKKKVVVKAETETEDEIPIVILDADAPENLEMFSREEFAEMLKRLEMTFKIEKSEPASSLRTGPGKVSPEQQNQEPLGESSAYDKASDKISRKKNVLKESWNKVAQRNSKSSKDIKPDDFIMILG